MIHPILFIHGFGGGAHEYRPIISFLKTHGNPQCHEFSYSEKFGQVSLKESARQMHEYISSHIAESEFDIIAISQGGIIARYYIAHFTGKKVRKCITLCTPHQGSLIAHFGIFPGVKELQPTSTLLAELDVDRAEYYAVYNPLDLMVFPGWNAKMKEAKANKEVYALHHARTFSHGETLQFIKSALTEV